MGRPRKGTERSSSSTCPPRKRAKKTNEMAQQPAAVHSTQSQSYPSSSRAPQFHHLLNAVGMASEQQQYEPPAPQVLPNQHFIYSPPSSYRGYPTFKPSHTSVIDPMLETFDVTRPTPIEDDIIDVSKCLEQANNYSSQNLLSGYSTTSHSHNSYDEHSFTPVAFTNNGHNPSTMMRPPNISNKSTQSFLSCACLANHYLINSKIQAASSSPATSSIDIPERIRLYRDALETAHTILNCESCLKSQITGVHNVFALISLLHTLILAYTKLLEDIFAEVDTSEREKKMKSFRMVELDNRSEEPAGMEIAMSPREWQRLILSALRKDIYSPPVQKNLPGPEHSHLTLESITVEMEARQKHIHATTEPVIKCVHNEFTCLKLLDQVKEGLAKLSLSRE